MVTVPSSSGWRMTSSTLRGNSGSSSRKSTPLWARETSPGRGIDAAADQAGVGDGVVRRAERPLGDQPGGGIEHAGDGVDLGRLQRFVEGERREDGGQALGQHRLARAGRADHENVVAAGGGDFERALGGLLAAHILEVDGEMLQLAEQLFGRYAKRLALDPPDHRGRSAARCTSSSEATG